MTYKENDFTTWPTIPYVSVCTPTFNRRSFIPMLIKCFNHQTYPKDRIEWIILDDGTDKINDLVSDHPNVKYFSYDEKMTIGEKRNVIHKKPKGDIIVYMNDDDYYPPERITHSVFKLSNTPGALCGGSSIMYMFFKHNMKIYKIGPYGDNHATTATFAFKKELLKITNYEPNDAMREEKSFLKNYTLPLVQFDPFKTILVFPHKHNAGDKTTLLDCTNNPNVKETGLNIDYFVKDPHIKQFFLNEIDILLSSYPAGNIRMKPDVVMQMLDVETQRRMRAENQLMIGSNSPYVMFQPENGDPMRMTIDELLQLLRKQQSMLNRQITEINGLIQENTRLKTLISD